MLSMHEMFFVFLFFLLLESHRIEKKTKCECKNAVTCAYLCVCLCSCVFCAFETLESSIRLQVKYILQ